MISTISRDELNIQKWDACVERAHNTSIYGCSDYLDYMASNWFGLVMGDYEAVLPLVFKKKKGWFYLCQTDFVQRTAIFSLKPLSNSIKQRFFKTIPLKYVLRDFCIDAYSLSESMKYTEKSNLTLPLSASHDILLSNYSKNTKRNLKRAYATGVEVKEGGSADRIVQTFIENRALKEGIELGDGSYTNMRKYINYCSVHGKGSIYSAYAEGEFLASVFFAKSAKRWYYLFSGVNEAGTQKRALFAIVDTFIKQQSGSQFILDFEGSMHPGVARFYKGFGAKEEKYYHLKHYVLNAKY